ncbi:hypothetical protein HNP33_004189 [Comamonas odontotermitis]|uniref:Uncharacterized protein n=1 Tax=Comamonas odontotermitis TaxID=379895 RepID=A0ABR6RM01_9BURK|nr:hypothetical protein [Comamonas odontotermitis]MBB6580063.1 hypothetical protein [Comamonas odontotermitis]
MQTSPRKKQLPGRVEALSLVLKQGVKNSSPALKQLAGMYVRHQPLRRPLLKTFTFSSGIDRLTSAERAALPF